MQIILPLLADAAFLNLDNTAWTAISALATAIAAIIALAAGFRWFENLAAHFYRPNLMLDLNRSDDFSSLNEKLFCVRIPVENTGNRTVLNAEVYLISVTRIVDGKRLKVLPVRLRWSHINSPTFDRIPSKEFRLVDLGFYNPGRVTGRYHNFI